MEEILIIIIQFFIEGIAQAILEVGIELAVDTSNDKTSRRILITLGAIVLGCAIGAVTLLIFPHSLIHYSWLRCLNLIFAPYLTYKISKLVAHLREREVTQSQLLFSVFFTFALVATRLAYATS